MARRPTIIDVAQRAGVSKSTVSLVLRGGRQVRESTRADVHAAMAALGYVYNRAAATLRGAGVGLVGLVINDLRNPFFTEFAASAQMTFASRGYATVIANTDEDPALQGQVITSMIEHGVSAFLISPAYVDAPAPFAAIERTGTPAMQVLRRIEPRTEVFPFASLDYAAGGRLAAQHLLGLGCRRIAFVGGLPDRPVTQERMAGCLEAMAAQGAPPLALHGRPSRALGRDMALHLARRRPDVDGVICFSDVVALGMLAGFAEAGARVGRDIRLVGFDDIEESALSWPQLSSVRCDVARFGRRAAEAMLRWLEDGERPEPLHLSPVDLIARGSSLGA